jgi:hypothetical protein
MPGFEPDTLETKGKQVYYQLSHVTAMAYWFEHIAITWTK